jgi:hypothetical protein
MALGDGLLDHHGHQRVQVDFGYVFHCCPKGLVRDAGRLLEASREASNTCAIGYGPNLRPSSSRRRSRVAGFLG